MKKLVYFRKPIIVKNGAVGAMAIVEYKVSMKFFDGVYMEHPSINEMLEADGILDEIMLDVPIFVLASRFRETLAKAVVPRVVLIDDGANSDEVVSMLERHAGCGGKAKRVFTRKEREVLEAMGYGLCNKEICQCLSISDRTVRRYKTKLLEKTGLLSTEQLCLFALICAENPRILRS